MYPTIVVGLGGSIFGAGDLRFVFRDRDFKVDWFGVSPHLQAALFLSKSKSNQQENKNECEDGQNNSHGRAKELYASTGQLLPRPLTK
jgi:hypothetical protein